MGGCCSGLVISDWQIGHRTLKCLMQCPFYRTTDSASTQGLTFYIAHFPRGAILYILVGPSRSHTPPNVLAWASHARTVNPNWGYVVIASGHRPLPHPTAQLPYTYGTLVLPLVSNHICSCHWACPPASLVHTRYLCSHRHQAVHHTPL